MIDYKPLATLLDGGTRNGLTKPKRIRGNGVKMIGMGEIFSNSRISDIDMERVPVTEKELLNCGVSEKDLLFARQSLVLKGAGKCSIVTKVKEPTVFESHLIRVRIDEELANPYFVYYFFNSALGHRYVMTIVEQVAAAGLRGSDLVKLKIPCPSIEVQNKSVLLLDKIDEKIEINNAINKNLSVLIQTIYQKRFTSKCQGILSDICMYSKERISVDDLTLDAYFSTENMLPNKAGVTTATSLPSTAQTTKCHIGDVLISNIRPYFKKILYCHREGGCSSDVLCFSPSSKKLSAFLYGVLYSDSFFDFMVAGSKGTKMPRGDKQQIMTYPIYVPTNDELDEYNSIAMPILDDIYRNTMENSNLSSLRDTLLPRLISGEVDVSSVKI